MSIIMTANNVTKRFGGLIAVNNFSLEIEEHSITSVIGPNGAGKTTFFNCITGFYIPEEGEIIFNGGQIQNLPSDKITHLGIARTYQNIRLFANMTALENILVGRHCRLKSSFISALLRPPSYYREEEEALQEATRLLNFIGLSSMGDQLARNLPYGAQRRLEIARALASDPKLVLLDEPTAGMNPMETGEMMRFIEHLRDELGITILLIEHDMKVIMGICTSISVMDFGTKIAEGTPQEIQRNPQVIEAYLGRGAATGLKQESERDQINA